MSQQNGKRADETLGPVGRPESCGVVRVASRLDGPQISGEVSVEAARATGSRQIASLHSWRHRVKPGVITLAIASDYDPLARAGAIAVRTRRNFGADGRNFRRLAAAIACPIGQPGHGQGGHQRDSKPISHGLGLCGVPL